MKLIFILILATLAACSKAQTPDECADVENVLDDIRPDILVIGDSISIGYIKSLRESLGASYDVSHNNCNAKFSSNGVAHIDEWLNQRDTWEAITFNHGLWDIADWVNTTETNYRDNIRTIALKIKDKAMNPYFITTTQVLPGTPHRINDKVIRYNEIAIDVMNELGIPIIDLYTMSATIPELHVSPDDVHYTDEGYSELSDYILGNINF